MPREEDKMSEINELLSDVAHRPWELPKGKWRYYQEWNNALFLHWKVSYEDLRKLVPKQLNIDTFHGVCYISLVAFNMEKIRPKLLPSLKFLSDFHEINIRTYIDNNNKKGVYFLNIEAEKWLSAFIAKQLSGLPYEKSEMRWLKTTYKSKNHSKNLKLEVAFTPASILTSKTELDKWLTERYCLYVEKGDSFYRYNIHHKEWKIRRVEINHLITDY